MTVTIPKAKWREAYAIIWGIPDDQLNLQSFYTDKATDSHGETARHVVTCGTIACTAGYLAAHPTWSTRIIGRYESAETVCNELYDSYRDVFDMRWHSPLDLDINGKHATDKQIALFRILRQLSWEPDDAWERVVKDTAAYQAKHGPKAVCGQSA